MKVVSGPVEVHFTASENTILLKYRNSFRLGKSIKKKENSANKEQDMKNPYSNTQIFFLKKKDHASQETLEEMKNNEELYTF